MKKNYFLTILSLLFCFALQAQVTYSGNGNSGFGGAIGGGSMNINDDGTTITCTFTKGAGNLNNTMVMYIATGATGRNVINGDINDTQDTNRRAISNTGSGDLTFPTGFEATHAASINTGFGGLWSIPAPPTIVGSNELPFVTAVGNPGADTDVSFIFTFDWSDVGLTSTDKFDFVITYGNPDDGGSNMFSADEAFGSATSGNPGFSAYSITDRKSYPNTWTGTTDNDWATATNWTEGVPSITDNVFIPKVTNQPTASSAVTVNKAIIKSGASLISQSTFNGTITSERNIPNTNWYLISSPVVGQDIDTFAAAEGLAVGSTPITNRGLGDYNNSTPGWEYYQVGATGTGNFISGDARAIKLATAGDIAFTGTMPDTNASIAINSNTNGFNLIGNPYTSYLALNINASAPDDLLEQNSSSLTETTA
ncbi:MAG: hypothetical protein ACKVIG_16840, partial [Flavobacteriales bacterium]